MRKYVDRLNKAIILGCFLVGVVTLDPTAMIASAVLYIATLNPRCSSLYYLMLIYNLHFSIRYIEQRLFGFEDVFTQPKVELLGGYFLLSAFMYLGIALAINASARTDRDRSLAFSTSLGKVGAVSILIFSALSFAGQYSIGREIGNPLSRLLIRLSLFLQYWVPALFFLKNWLLYAPIYIAGML
ncbi:MAG: hypothetical protein NTU88_09265, partial [Armatimonadetes bacterium]|nr:hypothetical protein [Armatimonadota bacterium]